MRCSRAQKLISEYLDGELDARRETHLRQHLDGCLDCRELLADFQAVVKEAGRLPEAAPSDAVWLKIKTGLDTGKREKRAYQLSRGKRWSFLPLSPSLQYSLGALLAVALIAGSLFFGLRGRGETTTMAKLKEAEHYYQLAIKALDEALVSQKDGMDPELARVLGQSLEVIDSSIAACEQVVRKDPNNIGARTYLLAAYGKKVSFLTDLMEIKKKSSSGEETKTSS